MRVDNHPSVVVAGHICLDLVIDFGSRPLDFAQAFRPGTLLEVGRPNLSAGGCVANTGLALSRLGIQTQLIARVGDDLFGRTIRELLEGFRPRPSISLSVASEESTSYTVVVDPPHVDRLFLHFPGTNRSFRVSDVATPLPSGTRIFHFGYPPILPETFADGGRALAGLLREVRAAGVCVSLDMTLPDPGTAAGRVDWESWMAAVLPEVDVFLPSLAELGFMFGIEQNEPADRPPELELLRDLSARSLGLGAGVVVLKLGAHGLYLRSSHDPARLSRLVQDSGAGPTGWENRELFAPCLQVEVIGTTGAGDATIAGFLASLVHGQTPEQAIRSAVTVGAFSVEGSQPASAIPSWAAVQERARGRGPLRRDGVGVDGAMGRWNADGTVWDGRPRGAS